MYYVTMTDRAMSGWGGAEGKINKLIFICDDYAEAETVAENAKCRTEMKYIYIGTHKPHFNEHTCYVQYKDKIKAHNWYKRGYFANNRENKKGY